MNLGNGGRISEDLAYAGCEETTVYRKKAPAFVSFRQACTDGERAPA